MMTAEARLVSVVIPVYNGQRYLPEAIQSVLAQTYRPLEAIVVDDGSTDSSAAIARGYAEVRYCRQSHGGAASARNRGIELATGGFLAFLDADDLWLPNKLARQVAALAADPALAMVFGQVEQFRSPELTGDAPEPAFPAVNGLHVGAMLIRRSAFERVGPFATEWQAGEFIDWYARAAELGLKQLILPEVVMRRRIHAGNLMVRQRAATVDYIHILKATLNRRRARGGSTDLSPTPAAFPGSGPPWRGPGS